MDLLEGEGEGESSSDGGVVTELFFEYIKNPADTDERNSPKHTTTAKIIIMFEFDIYYHI
jgi:hypothetical protein